MLGIDEETGEVLLISTSEVGYLGLKGQAGYENCASELKKIGSLYASGTGAVDGRSVTVEDINRITGYNPNNVGVYDPAQTGTGTAFGSGYVYEYGNEVTYTNNGGTIYYKGKYQTTSTSSSYPSFTYYTGTEWNSLEVEEEATLTSTYYYYYPTTLTSTNDTSASTGLTYKSKVYNMLFSKTYWLASTCICTSSGSVYYRVRGAGSSEGAYNLLESDGSSYSALTNVRAVVSLSTHITFTEETDGSWSISL